MNGEQVTAVLQEHWAWTPLIIGVVPLIGGGYSNRGDFWEMTAQTLGMVFCDTGKVSTKEERLDGWQRTGL